MQTCSGSQVCDDLSVRDCHNGVLGAVTDDCSKDGACSRGRCMSPVCAAADRVRTSFEGCVFYTAEVDNAASDADAPTSLLIANPGLESATVTLEQPGGDGSWRARDHVVVAGGAAARLSIAGLQVGPSGINVADGLRVLSTRPVTVAQIESDDNDQKALSSGGTMLLPSHVLGSHYLVTAYAQAATTAAVSPAGAPDGAGRLVIVGTQPHTTVTIKLSKDAPQAVTGMSPGDPLTFVLGDGDVYQAWTGADGEDLSGTEITADEPIALFSGNIVTSYGRSAPGVHSPDMAYEQIPPIASWSLQYVAASLPPQAGTCDTLLGQTGASVWRLLAGGDLQTNVTFAVPSGSDPPSGPLTLNAGESADIVATGNFVVSASGPLLVTQGIDCEPSLSLAVSADQLLDDVTFAVLPFFDQMVAVVRKQGDPILFDGKAIAETEFKPAGNGFEVARLTMPTCFASQQVCAHRLQGRFGMTMRGMDVLASYALTMPAWEGCHDSIDMTCVQ